MLHLLSVQMFFVYSQKNSDQNLIFHIYFDKDKKNSVFQNVFKVF